MKLCKNGVSKYNMSYAYIDIEKILDVPITARDILRQDSVSIGGAFFGEVGWEHIAASGSSERDSTTARAYHTHSQDTDLTC